MSAQRKFYGVMRVRDDPATSIDVATRTLIHGTINHGTEILRPGGERIATSYFGRESGIARAIRALGEAELHSWYRHPRLGRSVMTLARDGDTLHYYEINPLVFAIAKSQFGFYNACPASKQLYLGDGRLVLDRMPDENLDFLAMDAFSSDAVPIHLLTREAWSTYRRHLKPGGILAINITNRYLNLEPVIARNRVRILGWRGVLWSTTTEVEESFLHFFRLGAGFARSPEIFARRFSRRRAT